MKKILLKKLHSLTLSILFLFILFNVPLVAWADDYDEFEKMYVFGDSLSDIGNVFLLTMGDLNDPTATPGAVPFPAYYNAGRFSNGPVWVEYLADRLGITLQPSLAFSNCTDAGVSCVYAFGGSGTARSNLLPIGVPVSGLWDDPEIPNAPGEPVSQITDFAAGLADSDIDPEDALYIVWSGANNYLFTAFNQIFSPPPSLPLFDPSLSNDPAAVVRDIRGAIKELIDLGAEKILVANLPDLADVPLVAPELGVPDIVLAPFRADLTTRTLRHNRKLARMVRRINRRSDDADVILLDAYTLFKLKLENAVAGPARGCLLPPFFATPGSPLCQIIPPPGTVDFTNPGSQIWDEQHPTTDLHKLIAKRALRILRNHADD